MRLDAPMLFGGETSLKERLAREIKEARIGAKWTRYELAGFAGQAEQTVIDLEDRAVMPAAKVLLSFIWALRVDLDRLLPLPSDFSRADWERELKDRVCPLAGAEATGIDEDGAIELFVRLEALDRICPRSEFDVDRISEHRKRVLAAIG